MYLLILLPVAIHGVTKYLIFPLKTLKCDKMTACLSFAKHVGCNGYKLFCQIIFVCKRSIGDESYLTILIVNDAPIMHILEFVLKHFIGEIWND